MNSTNQNVFYRKTVVVRFVFAYNKKQEEK